MRGVAARWPYVVLVHDPVTNFVDDEALVELARRQLSKRSAAREGSDMRELRDKNFFLLRVEQPEDGAAKGAPHLVGQFNAQRAARRNVATGKQPQRVSGCVAGEISLLCRSGRNANP